MRLISSIFLAILFILFSTNSFSQWIEDNRFHIHARKGIDYVYNISFDSARLEFQHIVRLDPNHPSGNFFLAMVEWWNLLIDIDNTANDDRFIQMLEGVIKLCDKRLKKDKNDLAALFFKGGAVGYRGRLYTNRESWIRASNDGRIALPIVQQISKLEPHNYDVMLGTGIYNYYAAVIPEEYPFIKPLMIFFPKGNRTKGLDQLRKTARYALYANIEAKYFLTQILYRYEKQYAEALTLALELHHQYPNNPFFHRYVGRCYATLGRWEEMNTTFFSILQKVKEKKTGYNHASEREAQYYLGQYQMSKGNYETALQHFYRCDELSRILDQSGPSGFMVLTNLKIGMIHDLQLKRDIAVKQYKKVINMTRYQDSHDQAKRYLKIPYGKF